MSSARVVPLDRKYFGRISAGLDAALARSEEERLDLEHDRIAVFSDHHKGVGNPADDFRQCEHAYTSALGYYLEAGYRLFLLGDAEELWEERADRVIRRYSDVFDLELEFVHRGNGLERFYGNHDDSWGSTRGVSKRARAVLRHVRVRESLRLRVERPDRPPGILFFVHGHQGTRESDQWRTASHFFVRHVWRPVQRRTGYSATTPARSYSLRAKHDRAMYEWARRQRPGLVMIAGHTHRPVFARAVPEPPPTRPIADLRRQLEAAVASADTTTAAAIRAELEYARTGERRPVEAFQVTPPCYFNTGCCSFPDGDITGLEIAAGELRLVRWPANLGEMCRPGATLAAEKRILATEKLEAVFAAVTGDAPNGPGAVERSVSPA